MNMSASPLPISSAAEAPSSSNRDFLDPSTLTGRRLYSRCKRAFDFLLALAMFVCLLPALLLIAVLIVVDSGLPVLFVNRVVGQYGREFRLYKFRSMHPARKLDVERTEVERNIREGTPTTYVAGKPVYKTAFAEEARITRVGRVLRSTSLDEVPQLWNIFRGDMSFVGPRPSPPDEVRLYIEWQKQRLVVPQGLTGLYQVTARNRVPIEAMIRIDLEYIRKRSLWVDLKILCKTPRAMFTGL